MKVRTFLCLFVSLFLLSVVCAQAQEAPTPQTEEEILEEEFIRSRAENGDSHASGARKDLGPVILGNPSQAHKLIRVGLSLSIHTATAISNEFSTRHFSVAENVSKNVWTAGSITHDCGFANYHNSHLWLIGEKARKLFLALT